MTQTQDITRYELTDGPSADRLADAWKMAYAQPTALTVDFWAVEEEGRARGLRVRITGLEHEDGSGYGHFFTGQLLMEQLGKVRSTHRRGHHVKGWFYTGARRHGYIKVSPQPLP
ncbi:MAG TPA: hypothetical protein VK963_03155 [Candidatus Saccharimonadales bacterium]|nr:hypothetical protein [Candidatus Saccharimonadales bacterium]